MQETELLAAQSEPKDFAIKVVAGPDEGRSIFVDRVLVIGTSEHCDLKLTDRSVSRRHLTVESTGTRVLLRDDQSKNGTWVAGMRVAEVEVPADTEFEIGGSRLRLEEVQSKRREAVEPVADSFGRFVGSAPCLGPTYRVLELAAQSDVTVLLEGESGTGKELLAEALHERSPRAKGPFVVMDSAAVPENLIESELFGHEKGAFTGAQRARKGAFEEANGGTIFLDEIGELPPQLQTRLLGVLERRQFKRVGGDRNIKVDVRIVAATNRNLEREVEEGRFRLDLFHRLAVALVRVPPLRQRRQDIERLAHLFAKSSKPPNSTKEDWELIESETIARLEQYDWPGNVRELRNYIERLVIFGDSAGYAGGTLGGPSVAETIDRAAFGSSMEAILEAACSGVPYRQARAQVVDAFTALYVEEMLNRHGSAAEAAAAAGVARRHFRRLKQK